MRITIRALCQKRDDLDQRIIECRSQLYQNCPAVLVQSIRDKIQQLNSKLFQYLYQIKTEKFTNLVGPSSNLEPPKDNQLAVVTIPNNFPLSEPEKSVLSKGLNFVPIAKRTDEFSVKQELEKFLHRVQLKAFFHDKSNSKGWFPYDRRRSQAIADRGSQIADDRKESCFHIVADNRKRSQSRLLHTFRSADFEEETLLQANLFLFLVLKRRHRQRQNRRKHRFWVRRIFLKRQELGAFHTLPPPPIN